MTQTEIEALKMGQEIKASLCAVYVSVKRPTGRIRIDSAVIEAPNTDGELQTIKSKYISGKNVRYDFNQMWMAIDDNEKEIRRLVTRMTAHNLQRGTYMMSMVSVGSFILTLKQLREDRLELVDQMNNNWEAILEEIREEYPDHHHLFIDKIPMPDRTRFDVYHEVYPLGTLSPDDLDLSNLTQVERDQVIEDTRQAADEMFKNRLQGVYDGVFGAVMEICEDVEKRGFESGKRRQGAVTNILDVLERARNFAQFANPDTMEAINSAFNVMNGLKIQELNSNIGGVQEKLRATFASVRGEVERLRETYEAGSSRSVRTADV